MQDINPVKRTIDVKENTLPDDVPFREQVGIEDDAHVTEQRREQVNFSNLYTPESRRNVVQQTGQGARPSFGTTSTYQPRKEKEKKVLHIVAGFVGLFALLAFVAYTFIFSSVTVTIKPVRQSVEVAQTVTIAQEDIMLGDNAKLVTATSTKSTSVERRGTSKVETKASGTIIIYNSFDKNPQKLITNTRFESKEGKTYRIAESITVPGMNGTNPGSIEALVYADSVGDEYNIASTELTVPGFKGTPRYQKFTAKTKTALEGGFSGVRETVADEDVEKAKQELIPELEKTAQESIKLFNPGDDYVLIPDTVRVAISDNRKDLPREKNLEYVLTASATAVYVKKEYIEQKIKEVHGITDEEDTKLKIENFSDVTMTSVIANGTNKNIGGVSFNISGTPTFIAGIDEAILATTLAGTKKSEFTEKMKKFGGVLEAKSSFRPPWKSSFPKDTKQIHLKIVQ